jgi:hypothetical protein
VRTTVTLDPDVEAALREVLEREGGRRKELINEAIRRGLAEMQSPTRRRPSRYRTPPYDPGPPAVRGVHSIHDLLAFAEGEDFR